MYSIAILAGGLATRLKPITETIPKALVPVAGKPFISWQLGYLKKQGIKKVVLCVGHLGEQIKSFVGSGDKFGLSVSYSHDGEKLLGTGGALKKSLTLLSDNFFVQYGDSFLPICYSTVESAFKSQKKPALMTVYRNYNSLDTSNVIFDRDTVVEYNKYQTVPEMEFIDYGLAVLSKDIFKDYSENQAFDLAGLYHELSVNGQLAGFEANERFYEVGSHSGLKSTAALFGGKEIQ